MSTLATLLSSKVKAQVFRLLFDGTGARLHVRDLERRSGLAIGTVRQELKRLKDLDLVEAQVDGNRTYYRANQRHPLYPDICNIVRKTSGLVDVLRPALLHDHIQIAFIFGSVAREEEQAHSDIDLMVIGSIGLRELSKCLGGIANQIGREINPHVMTADEFRRREKEGEHFLSSVLASPRLYVIGDDDELETVGK
jgi:uncharacterized protein